MALKLKKVKNNELPTMRRGGTRSPRYLETVEALAADPDTWYELEVFEKASSAGSFRNTIKSNMEYLGYEGEATTRAVEGGVAVYARVVSEGANEPAEG